MSADEVTALMKRAGELFAPIPSMVPSVKGNPVTREKIELGRMLWFDPRLSSSGILSCNSCHNLATGGADNVETSIGHGWQKGPRNAPTVLNSVFNIAQFWDGRAEDLRTQAKGPIQAGVEMAATPELVAKVLKSIPEYVQRFTTAFPGESDPVTFDNLARAIEAFEATLITPASRFVVERPGADVQPRADKGRFAVTNTATDEYVFRAVPLRNVALTSPYFHSGRVWNLEQAVAIMGSSQLGRELTTGETATIAAFLRTLTGQHPRVDVPMLPPSTSTTPQPQPMGK